MANRIYFFAPGSADGDASQATILGGKGAGLAAMSKANLPVPPGFTISTECCKQFLQSEGAWPDGLLDDIRAAMRRLEDVTGRKFGVAPSPLLVSVRSGAAVSMPGMMDTILNCGLSPDMAQVLPNPDAFWRVYSQFVLMFTKTLLDIPMSQFQAMEHAQTDQRQLAGDYEKLYLDRTGRPFPHDPWQALRQCIETVFNSWNNQRAIIYRRQHDIRGLPGTAVTIQSMFPSEVSGIVFTTNPNNLAAEEIIIESSYGLGEAVVSGDVHPDQFLVDRNTLAVKSRQLGHKVQQVSALGDLAAPDPDAASLTDAQVREVAELSMRVEKFFGRPMDLEFGMAGGKLALLQSRPIRGLEIAQDVEIGRQEEIKRLASLVNGDRKLWVLHNLAETLPAPTPLTWDIIRRFMSGDGGFGRMYRDFGYSPTRRVGQEGFLELICGRIYADPQRAAELFFDGMPLVYDLDQVATDPKILDSAPTAFNADAINGRFFLRLPVLLRSMLRTAKLMKQARAQTLDRFLNQVLPPYLRWVEQKRSQNLAALSTRQLLAELDDRIRAVLTEFGGESLKPGFFGGIAQASLQKQLTQLMGQEQGAQLALQLTQGLDGDSTIEQNTDLWKLAAGKISMQEFLATWGHRAVEEMELSRPRWREDDSYVQQMLGFYNKASMPSPMQRHHQLVALRQEAEKGLPAHLRQWGGSSLLEDIQRDMADSQMLLPYRETAKHYLMMGYETIRMLLVELSRRWNLGRDVFFLTLDVLPRFERDKDQLLPVVAARKTRWQSARRLDPSEVIDSRQLNELGRPRQYAAATELAASPIASGVATGTARIVNDPSQAGDLGTDYVLVCHSTDPGWTALFVGAKGLVVEQGGVLSHGAIVARDFGIPAVVCPDAKRRIPHGSTIRVDGNRGKITLL